MGRYKKIILAILLCILNNNNFLASSENDSKKLNVLFIIADDLNCDIGAYGNDQVQTPNIDRLAREGVLFENAHVQYPLCGPSRISLMTGLYPDQTKSKDLRLYLRQTIPDVITIGQRFILDKYNSVRVTKSYSKSIHTPTLSTNNNSSDYLYQDTPSP